MGIHATCGLTAAFGELRRLCSGESYFCVFCAFLRRLLAFVGGYSFGEGVPVDAQHNGRIGEVLLVFRERLLDVELFEFAERLIEKDVALEHFVDEAF